METITILTKLINYHFLNEDEKLAILDGIYALENKQDKIKNKRNSMLILTKIFLPQFDKDEKQAITNAIKALSK